MNSTQTLDPETVKALYDWLIQPFGNGGLKRADGSWINGQAVANKCPAYARMMESMDDLTQELEANHAEVLGLSD